MREILKKIPARCVMYDVIVTNEPEILPRDSDGYIDPDKEYIAISSRLKTQMQWETLLHEWAHAQVRHHNRAYFDDVFVDDLAVGVMELLKFIGYLK